MPRQPIYTADRRPYREGRAELAAYILTVLLLISLGIIFTSVVLNWIIGPTLSVIFVVVLTPLCRWVDRRLKARP